MDSKSEDDDDESSENYNKKSNNNSLDGTDEEDTASINWSGSEEQLVDKKYGMSGTLFPKAWIEGIPHVELENDKNSVSTTLVASQINFDVNEDPLGITTNADQKKKARKTILGSMKIDPSILITDKKFDPKLYLLSSHKSTTFKQLEQGVATLKNQIDLRDDNLKGLVKGNFSKFVNAKVTIDCKWFIDISVL